VDVNDRALILRAQQRDVAAFSALVERWWVYLVRFARSVVGEADAEDVVQDGLLTIWDKLPALRVPEAFPAWTVRIISRACFRRARRQRKMVPLTAAVWAPDSSSARRIEAIDVESVLSALPPRQRAVMHLTVIEEMTDSQIGDALGISAASVRSHRRRARETLSVLLPALARISHQVS
jgi:RNA polymerase sigma-70 factor (ECF subfamily)